MTQARESGTTEEAERKRGHGADKLASSLKIKGCDSIGFPFSVKEMSLGSFLRSAKRGLQPTSFAPCSAAKK